VAHLRLLAHTDQQVAWGWRMLGIANPLKKKTPASKADCRFTACGGALLISKRYKNVPAAPHATGNSLPAYGTISKFAALRISSIRKANVRASVSKKLATIATFPLGPCRRRFLIFLATSGLIVRHFWRSSNFRRSFRSCSKASQRAPPRERQRFPLLSNACAGERGRLSGYHCYLLHQ
jgi:hypothetical protein